MTSKKLYDRFASLCPWFTDDVIKYQGNHKEGGIDIFMKDGSILNFQIEGRSNWTLKRVN